MNLCIILSIYSAMANVHMDTPATHKQILDGAKFLEQKCEESKKVEEKKEEKKK